VNLTVHSRCAGKEAPEICRLRPRTKGAIIGVFTPAHWPLMLNWAHKQESCECDCNPDWVAVEKIHRKNLSWINTGDEEALEMPVPKTQSAVGGRAGIPAGLFSEERKLALFLVLDDAEYYRWTGRSLDRGNGGKKTTAFDVAHLRTSANGNPKRPVRSGLRYVHLCLVPCWIELVTPLQTAQGESPRNTLFVLRTAGRVGNAICRKRADACWM